MSTEVTVPASSRVRLRFSGANPRSAYASPIILPGTTIAMYWSDASTLNATQAPTVRPIKPTVLLTPTTKAWVIRCSMPVACKTDPNVMAHTMSHTVFSIPFMPLLDRSSSANAWPVVMATSKAMACIDATYEAAANDSPSPATCRMTSGWKTTAVRAPRRTPMNRAGAAGTLRAIITSTAMGATNKPGWMENAPATASPNPGAISALPDTAPPPNPTTKNTTKATKMLGPVVYAM